MSTNFTLEQLKCIEDAFAKGILTVRYQDKVLTYRSVNEMLKVINHMRTCLGLQARGGRLKVCTTKGTC